MSTMSFSTGSKAENAVYLAFGFVVAVALIRWLTPDLFLIPTNVIAVSTGLGSLIGSLFFLVRLDNSVTWGIKKLTLFRYREILEKHIIRTDIALSIWDVFVTETWETPKEKSNEKLSRLMDGPILHNDIWSLKGAFYFCLSIPCLFFAFDIDTLSNIIITLALWIIVCLLIWYNYEGFLFRCVQLASYLSMKETRSVVQLRKKHKSVDYSSSGYDAFSTEIVDTFLDDLESMAIHQDWRGFKRRMDYFLETLEQEVQSQQSVLSSRYTDLWAGVISGYDETSRQQSLIRTKVMKKILKCAIEISCFNAASGVMTNLLGVDDSKLSDAEVLFKTVDGSGLSDRQLDSMFFAFGRLKEPPVNSKIVEIILKWYKEGQLNYAENLRSAIEYVDDNLRERAVHALLNHKEENIWQKAGNRVTRTVLNMSGSRVEQVKLMIVQGGDRSNISDILKESKTDYYELIREVTNFILDENPSLALSAVEFFMRVDKDLMVTSFLPALFKEQSVTIKMNTTEFLGRLWNIDESLFSGDWKEKREAYRPFLLTALDDEKPGVRRIALEILKTVEPTSQELEMVSFIANNDPDDELSFAAKKIINKRKR